MFKDAKTSSYRSKDKQPLVLGLTTMWLTLIVLLPLAAVLSKSFSQGPAEFWSAVSSPQAVKALKLTIGLSVVATLINGLFGTLIAWVLVRDDFRGKRIVNSLIDLPFALPTIVASIVLLALVGTQSPIKLNLVATHTGIVLALLFVTLPFVVRSVQPVMIELDRDVEQAAASLGASNFTILRKIVLPSLLPALVSGIGLAFSRAVGEYGSVVLISGNTPNNQVVSQFIFDRIETDRPVDAAAISVVLLVLTFVVLIALRIVSAWSTRYEK